MHQLTWLAFASTLGTLTTAQSASITSVFLPFADQQDLEASIIAQTSKVATLLLQCPTAASDNECGFPTPLTITAGPSTLHYSPSGIYQQLLGEIDCKITSSAETAVCALTSGIFENSGILATATDDAGEYSVTSASSSTTATETLTGSDVAGGWVSITITAAAAAGQPTDDSDDEVINSSSTATGSMASTSASNSSSSSTSGTTGSASSHREIGLSVLALSGIAIVMAFSA